MSGRCGYMYQAARVSAGLTQESAAERLGLAVRTLADYEGGRTAPQPETVCAMVELYDAPALGIRHACMLFPFLRQYLPEGESTPLSESAIRLTNRIFDFADQHQDRRLLRIAEDGVIDDRERPEFDRITDDLEAIIRAGLRVACVSEHKKAAPYPAATGYRAKGVFRL